MQRRTFLWLGVLCVCVLGLNVVELNETTFDKYVEEHPYSMINFYASWCEHCKAFEPEYEYLAGKMKEEGSPYSFARIDANINYNVREKQHITRFPTLRVWVNGSMIEYKRDTVADEVIDFLNRKLRIQISRLNSKTDIESWRRRKGLQALLLSDDPYILGIFKETAKMTSTDVEFSYISEALGKSAFPDVKQLPCVVLQKEGEDNVIYTPIFGKSEFKDFLRLHESPKLSFGMTTQLADLFLQEGKGKTGVILYRTANQTHLDSEFAKVREELPDSDLVFVKSTGEGGEDQPVARYLMVTEKDLPMLLVARMVEREVQRWALKGELKKENMLNFLRGWREGKAPRTFRTAEAPTNNSGPVFAVVSSTFAKEVLQPDQDVVVKFYAPWCSHCKELAPIYLGLAQKMVGQSKLKFVEIDSTVNEVEGHPIRGYPVVKLFPAKNKAKSVILETKTEADLLKGIKEHASYPLDQQWKVDL